MLEPSEDGAEQRARIAEGRAADLLAEVCRLQVALAAAPSRRPAAQLAAAGDGAEPTAKAPSDDASRQRQPEPAAADGWGLGGWGMGAVVAISQATAVALEAGGVTAAGGAEAAAAAAGGDGGEAAILAHRWSLISSLWVDGAQRQCLCLADAKSCQVWDVGDPSNVRQLMQLHLRGVSCMAPLHGERGAAAEGALLSDLSVLALGVTDDEGATTLGFFSLAQGGFVQVQPDELAAVQAAVDLLFGGAPADDFGHASEPPTISEPTLLQDVPLPGVALRISLPSMVCDLITAAPHLVVAVEGAVALLDCCTALPAAGQTLRIAAALPPPPAGLQRTTVAIAASTDWLAYSESPAAAAAAAPASGGQDGGATEAEREQMSLSGAMTAATDIGNLLYDAVSQPAEGTAAAGAGRNSAPPPLGSGVVVLERLNGARPSRIRFAAHHSSAVSALQFNSTGSLLVTASRSGKTLKVFQMPSSEGVTEETDDAAVKDLAPVLLYNLTRGTFMEADICSIGFSADSLFVVVATSHGTAHVFAISPSGGAIDAVTHGIGGAAASAPSAVQKRQGGVPSLVAVARVKRSWIPSSLVTQAMPESQTATHYTIRCSAHSGANWEVSKRYSELASLKAELESHERTAEAIERIAKNAEFPGKTWGLGSWGKLDESTIAERKEKLQLWLGNVLQHCVNEPTVLEFLRPDMTDRVAAALGDEWPIRVEFVKTENKSDGTLLPMATAFFAPGGGALTDANGAERTARESFLVFSAGRLSLHHVCLDLQVTLCDGGEVQTTAVSQ